MLFIILYIQPILFVWYKLILFYFIYLSSLKFSTFATISFTETYVIFTCTFLTNVYCISKLYVRTYMLIFYKGKFKYIHKNISSAFIQGIHLKSVPVSISMPDFSLTDNMCTRMHGNSRCEIKAVSLRSKIDPNFRSSNRICKSNLSSYFQRGYRL